MDELKIKFAAVVVVTVGALQGIAWITGKNGAVFAFTSAVIGGIAGVILGFTYKKSH